jgi:hypothetical protein
MNDEIDDESEQDDSLKGKLLPLEPHLQPFMLQFMSEIRTLTASARIGPGESIQASKALFALSRLPLTTPGMLISVEARDVSEHGQINFIATLGEHEFSLTSIESIYGEYGSDHQSQVFLSAYHGSHLNTDFYCSVSAAHDWLNRWSDLTRNGRVSFSDEFDESGWYDEDDIYPTWDDLGSP